MIKIPFVEPISDCSLTGGAGVICMESAAMPKLRDVVIGWLHEESANTRAKKISSKTMINIFFFIL